MLSVVNSMTQICCRWSKHACAQHTRLWNTWCHMSIDSALQASVLVHWWQSEDRAEQKGWQNAVEPGTHWRMTVHHGTALQALDGSSTTDLYQTFILLAKLCNSCFFIFKTACCRASQGKWMSDRGHLCCCCAAVLYRPAATWIFACLKPQSPTAPRNNCWYRHQSGIIDWPAVLQILELCDRYEAVTWVERRGLLDRQHVLL